MDNQILLEDENAMAEAANTEEPKPTRKPKQKAGTEAPAKTVDEPRKFKPDDMIECMSITPGELLYEGPKTKTLYEFTDAEDVCEVEYQDLDFSARSRSQFVMQPLFVIKDNDFIEAHPQLKGVYDEKYSPRELRRILEMYPDALAEALMAMPKKYIDTFIGIATSEIDSGRFDSAKRARAIDSVCGTALLQRMSI